MVSAEGRNIKSNDYRSKLSDHFITFLDVEYNVSQLDNVRPTSVGSNFVDGSK